MISIVLTCAYIVKSKTVARQPERTVRLVDYKWNQLESSLRLMYEKLAGFGLDYHDGEVVFTE